MANTGHITVEDGFEWDDEVDVVCTDTALGGVATAIAAVRNGGTVFLASAVPAAEADWFRAEHGESETTAYLHELTADIDVATLPRSSVEVPVRLVGSPKPADPVKGRRIATFDGARLRDWAMQCIPARSGYLYTRVTDWPTTTVESDDGRPLSVAEIGVMTPDVDDVAGSVGRWLTAAARGCGIVSEPVTALERLVFDHGVVIGAEFATDDGPLTVRARHGVLVCRAVHPHAATGSALAEGSPVRVALVGTAASRFGRVELLTSDPALASVPHSGAQLGGVAASGCGEQKALTRRT